ncbi:MAG TPA: ribonuclease HI family protein [Acidobacteriaceae bacterium]
MPSLFPEPPKTTAHWINAHCDGGARGNPGPAGYGALIQDDAGNVLAELSEFLGHKTNNFAEYSGLLGCLQWALDHGHKQLRVVSDSELMVKQIQGKYKVNSPDLRPLWEEARRRIARLDGFQISHALRHKNKDADRLANEAMDRGAGHGLRREPSAGERAPARSAPEPAASAPKMVRGFTRDGAVHLLGGAKLPDGVFVKVIVE